MSQTISQEDLAQLKSVREQVLQLASALGELGYQEVLINLEKEKITNAIKEVRAKEQSLLQSFGQQYGDGIVDLETGEIKPRQ